MRRVAKRITSVVAAALALAAVLTAWLVGTESGLRTAWRLAAGVAPVEIEAGALEGRIVGPLVVTGLRYAAPGLRTRIERLELDWRPTTLLRGVLTVERVHAVGVEAVRVPGEAEADDEPWQLPERLPSPIDVDVTSVAVEDLRLRSSPDASPIDVDAVRFALRFDDDSIAVEGLDVRGPLFDAAGRMEVEPGGSYRTALELDATLRPPGRPEARARARASGTLDALTVRIAAEPPYAAGVELVIADALEQPAIDGSLRAQIVPAEVGLDIPIAAAGVELALAGPIDDLSVTGRADAEAPGLVDAELEVAARWLGGAVEIETLEITERGGPAAVRLAGRIELDPEPTAMLGGEWSGLRWPLAGEAIAASPAGTIELSGTPARLDARLAAAWDDDGRVEGRIRREGERLGVELDWRDVSWPPSESRLESRRGALRVMGTLDAYTLALDAELAAAEGVAEGVRADGAAGHLRAEGRGDRTSLELAAVDVAVLDGKLAGSGRVGWDPALDAFIDVEFADLDPGLLVPEWAGRIGGGIEAKAAVVDGGFTADVARLDVEGTLRDRPIDLDASGRYHDPHRATIDHLRLRSAESTLAASGTIGEEVDVEWRIDSPNLDDFWPGLAGELSTSGRARGPYARPLVEAEAAGDGLAVDDIEIGALSLTARLDVGGAAESNLVLALRDARVAGRSIERLEIRAVGTAARHRLSADLSVDGIESALALSGTVERPWEADSIWRFAIDGARIAPPALPEWTLDGPAAGALTADGAELERACLRSADAALCVDAARRGERTEVGVELSALPFGHFAAYWPRDTRLTGELSAQGRLELAPELPPRAALTITTTPARISAAPTATGSAGLAFAAGRASFAFDGARLDAELDLPLARGPGGIDGRASMTLRDGEPLAASRVDGRVRAELGDLAFLSQLVRGIDGAAGSMTMDVRLFGTVVEPRIAGNVTLEDGAAQLRELGIVVEQVDVRVTDDGSGRMAFDASATSGGGTLEADGVLSFDGSVPVGRLALRGDAFEVANTPDAQLFASPDLVIELTPERLDLTGSVLIPRASFTPRDTIEGAVTVSGDQIIVDAEDQERRPLSRPLYARIALSLGDAVTFDGFGLTGRLGGALEIVEVPAEPVTGSGELRVESGTYEAYGQELEVRRGRLLFAGGAIARPGLDIEAVRRPTEDILVGARVRGTLDRPELSVFSEPTMPREEQLSYLVLGRPLESASGSETSALSQAAMALGLRGGNFVSERLNRALGFDEFGIESRPAEANSASFVIGKYLTPSLYVSYGVGLFEPVNTLRLRYTISRRWRLVTESSTAASGGDLIYHIERGD